MPIAGAKEKSVHELADMLDAIPRNAWEREAWSTRRRR